MNIWFLVALLAGICATFQSAVNGKLSEEIGTPSAMTLNMTVFTVVTFVYLALEMQKGPLGLEKWRQLDWYQYLGGLFGFGVVICLTLSFPRLGALAAVVLMILGQSASAVLVDHRGWFGMNIIAVSAQRIVAIGFILAGVFLLKK